MPWVTKEQIARAKEANALDYILQHEPDNFKKVGNRYVMREHDSFVISSDGKWIWNSRGYGAKEATALNFLIKVRGFGFPDAVRILAGDAPAQVRGHHKDTNPPPAPTPGKPPFSLPPRNRNNDRVIAYLLSRGIDRESIDACIADGILYESVNGHNCVFLGKNEDGLARYACFRGTTGQYKRDADGSDKRCCFLLQPLSPENYHKAACFESPTDALSHQSLFKAGYTDFDGWRLSLGGGSIVALTHFLAFHPFVDDCRACTDNDDAGKLAAAKIMALPQEDKRFSHISAVREAAPIGKDWNDTLKEFRRRERQSESARTAKDYRNVFIEFS